MTASRSTGPAVEVAVIDAVGRQAGPGQAEEPGELAEHQDPVPVLDDVVEHLHEGVELGGRHPFVLLVDERDVEAGLPQQGERAEDGHPVLVHVAEEAEDLLALALQVGLVDLLVPRVEVELEDLLLLVGEVTGHLLPWSGAA